MSFHKLAGADFRADRNFERADLRTSTVVRADTGLKYSTVQSL